MIFLGSAIIITSSSQVTAPSPVTPLKDDFSPDLPTFEKLLDFHVRTGATAISWPHHKGESLNLSIKERKAFAEVAVKTVAGRVPVSVLQPEAAPDEEVQRGRLDREAFGPAGDLLRGEPLAERRLRARVLPGAERRVGSEPQQGVGREAGRMPLQGQDRLN